MNPQPATPAAFKLMQEGSQALAEVESHGIRIDTAYLDKAIEWSQEKIDEYDEEMREDDIYSAWQRRFGVRADVTSPKQFQTILFDEMGLEVKSWTSEDEQTRQPKMEEEALQHIDLPFVKTWIERRRMVKTRSTYLLGIRAELANGFLHPVFNLHFAQTFRSSSDSPNFQNFPNRNPKHRKIVRRAFIPYDDESMLIEIDYGALEFRGAACFWQDPAMIAYASDPSLDIHRDMAAECYELDIDQVTKAVRSLAKNRFVFPTLYGSWYGAVGEGLWSAIEKENLTLPDGTSLYDHLATKGISSLGSTKNPTPGTYQHHAKAVQEAFADRFPHWAKQKDIWWEQYLKNGWFRMKTGFVCSGVYSLNDLMNYPIQGASFHLLLWSLTRLNEWMKKKKMQSRIVGQIHDSIVSSVRKDELDDFMFMANKIMTQDVREHWDWVVTPLEIEAEGSDTNWNEMKPLPLAV